MTFPPHTPFPPINHCEVHISKDVSARLPTSPYLNGVLRVKSLSLCKGGNKLSLKVQDCHPDQFEIEEMRNKPFSILVCVREQCMSALKNPLRQGRADLSYSAGEFCSDLLLKEIKYNTIP